MAHANPSLSQADRVEILDLFARQAHLIDEGEAERWAATFCSDGFLVSPTYGIRVVGHDALRQFAEASRQQALDRNEQLRHHQDQILIEPHGDSFALVKSYLVIIAVGVTGARSDRSLTTVDELVKEAGDWRMKSRHVLRDDAHLAGSRDTAE
jgi:hypothetical protein